MHLNPDNSRREFLGTLAGGTLAISSLLAGFDASAKTDPKVVSDAEDWFNKIKGKHKIVYDCPEPNGGFAIVWSWVYYATNNQTGSPDSDLTAMVVIRHAAIPLAMEDKLWEKYKFGESLHITDSQTNAPATKNIYIDPKEPFWTSRGIQGIKDLMARGVMFCVCEMAITSRSQAFGKAMKLNPEDVKKEFIAGILPGIQIVPSGVWAIGRAQEKGCGYCYAGG
jgi:intracellular sulfur oxidation DsrE/DsrF family protein